MKKTWIKNKIGILLVSALLVPGLAGCGEKTNTSAEESTQAQESTQAGTQADTQTQEETDISDAINITEVPDAALYEKQFELPKEGDIVAVLNTSMGDITIRFFPEEAPKAVENFVGLAQSGYYDGVKFHRVIDGFMIQSGDPEGTGMGGESIFKEAFEDEFSPWLHNYRGALSMANSGLDTNGSQFFIVQKNDVYEEYLEMIENTIKETPDGGIYDESKNEFTFIGDVYPEQVLEKYRELGGTPDLDYRHTVFGQVIEGMDVVDAIAKVEVKQSEISGEASVPAEDVLINSVTIKNY